MDRSLNEPLDAFQFIEDDAEELTTTGFLIMSVTSDKPVTRTRLQKMSLLYYVLGNNSKNSHEGHFFGGYSDDIDESSRDLVEMGILSENSRGYQLTKYGTNLIDYAKKGNDFALIFEIVSNINKSLKKVGDREIVAMTYHYYPELAKNSTIKTSIDRVIQTLKINGKPIGEVGREEFESIIKKGNIITSES